MLRPARVRKKNKRYFDDAEEFADENSPPSSAKPGTSSGKRIRIDVVTPFLTRDINTVASALDALDVGPPSPGSVPPMDVCKASGAHTTPQEQQVPSPMELDFEEKVSMEETTWERPDGVGSPGQFKWVLLENFMCHEHFKMEFVPNINFISGQNGSGKSALLQAIQQVLGTSARETGRASSQTSFVRTGAHEAKVVICLWNEGPEAYRPSEFGKEIIIERVIGKRSSWAIKSAKGVKIGQRRADIDEMLMFFSIDGSNPIAVMTQDVTRSFLAGSTDKSDKQKFAIYQQATRLDQIKALNDISAMKVEEVKRIIEELKAKIEKVKKERDAARKDVESMRQVDELRREVAALGMVLVWVAVRNCLNPIDEIKGKLAVGPSLIEKAEADLQKAQEDIEASRRAAQSQVSRMDLLSSNIVQAAAEAGQCKAAHAEAAKLCKEKSKEIEKLECVLEQAKKDHEEVKATIVASTESAGGLAAREALTQYGERVAELNAHLKDQGERTEHLKEVLGKEVQNSQAAMRRHDEARRAMGAAESKVNVKKQALQQAKAQSADRRNCFGRYAKQLHDAIQSQYRRFHRTPIGPTGYHLTVEDDRWRVVADAAMGKSLEMFIVHDHHDLHVLRDIVRMLNIPLPPVTISRFDVPQHTISPERTPPQDKLTILHILRCTDPKLQAVVMNAIVDQAKVERTVLCYSEDEARESSRHPHCEAAYLPDGSYFRNKGKTQTRFPARWTRHRLAADTSSYISSLEQDLQDAQAWLDNMTQEVEAAGIDAEHKNAVRLAAHAAYVDSRKSRDHAEQERDTYAATQQENLSSGDGETDMQVLQEELTKALNRVTEVELELVPARAILLELKEKENLAKEAWEKARETATLLETSNTAAQNEIEGRESAREAAEAEASTLEETLGRLKAQMEEWESALKTKLAESEQIRAMAEQVCSEEEGRTTEATLRHVFLSREGWTENKLDDLFSSTPALEKLLDKKMRKIKKAEKEAGGITEEVEANCKRLELEFSERRNGIQSLISYYHKLKHALDLRISGYDRLSRDAELMVGTLFNKYMARKGHSGSIEIDKENKTLNLKVRISGSEDGEKVKDLKQLSGGERSYTTVCFALAVGEYIQAPFRAMDEFDVFMDAINRRISMVSLFENALLHKDIQFLFLTPQDVSAVEEAKQHLAEVLKKPVPDGFLKVLCMPAARPAGRIAS